MSVLSDLCTCYNKKEAMGESFLESGGNNRAAAVLDGYRLVGWDGMGLQVAFKLRLFSLHLFQQQPPTTGNDVRRNGMAQTS